MDGDKGNIKGKGVPKLITYGRAAEIFGIGPTTVADVVRLLKIEPKRFPMNGRAKGLDQKDLERLAKLFGFDPKSIKTD